VGTFGQGVFVGRLAEVAGSDLDEVIVVGCSEGAFPPRAADDPLLPDRDRRAAGPALRRRGITAAEEERDVLAVMAAAPDTCTLTFPVADPREQRTRQPAPFVLEQCSSLLGERVDTDDVTRLRDDARASRWFVDLPSFEWWLANGGTPATPTELDVGELVRARAAREPLERLPIVHAALLDRGLRAATARIAGAFDEWSGWVGRWEHLADDLQHPRSPTSLQQWATCPFRYFLGHVLDLEGLEDPGDEETITAADRGTLVHAVLEEYFRSRIEGEPRSIDDIAGEIEGRFRAQGRTGRPLLWDAEWRALRRHLHQILAAGDADPVLAGVDPVAVEYRFGVPDPETGDAVAPVVVDIANDRQMRFRGAVDRIDRSSDGRRLVVLDYKTGSSEGYAVLDPEHVEHDIVARGTLLQLPIYAAAAQAAYPGATEVEAYYWFIGQRGVPRFLGGPIDAPAQERFQAVMRTIADGIEGGVFPARPGEEEWRPSVGQTHRNCVYCPYDKLCPAGRGEQWVALRERDELRAYVELAEDVAVADDDAVEQGGEA
jgi:RecB family exonuclease